jgi:hypothetical protein
VSNQRISDLIAASTLTGSEEIPLVQAGVTHKTTLANLLGAGMGGFNLTASPTGNEPLVTIEGGTTVQITLAQLYQLFTNWLAYVGANPLDSTSSGDIHFATGTVGSTPGNLILTNLPTADPHVVNAVWNSGGTLKLSAG